MQSLCRHYSASSTLGKKKGDCLLLDRVLRLRLLDSDPALAVSLVGSGGFSGAPCESRSLPLQSGQIRAINQSH